MIDGSMNVYVIDSLVEIQAAVFIFEVATFIHAK